MNEHVAEIHLLPPETRATIDRTERCAAARDARRGAVTASARVVGGAGLCNHRDHRRHGVAGRVGSPSRYDLMPRGDSPLSPHLLERADEFVALGLVDDERGP